MIHCIWVASEQLFHHALVDFRGCADAKWHPKVVNNDVL